MSVLLILKSTVPMLLRKMGRPFKVPVAKQKEFLSSFPEPKNNMERTYYQYKCQILFWGKWFHVCASVVAFFLLPIQMLIILLKRNTVIRESVDLLLLSEDMPNNIYPEELLCNFTNRKSCSFLDGYSLTHEDWRYFIDLAKMYPFSPYFLYKCLVKMAMYSYQINKNNPKVIATCGGEFTYTSSLLTDFCKRHKVKHFNTMHGEMFYYILDSFCNFHKFYVWDAHYKELLVDLRATADEFIIAPPKSVIIDLEKIDVDGLKIYDFKYYLQLQYGEHMKQVAEALNKLKAKGFSVCVRYHPRTPNVSAIYKAFNAIEIENPKQISIEQSIKTTKSVIALNSTVLFQAYMSGVSVVIDDITNVNKYTLLGEMQYVMLSKKHRLLSQCIEE